MLHMKGKINLKHLNENIKKSGTTIVVRNNNINEAIRIFNKMVRDNNIVQEYREKISFVSKGEKNRKDKRAAKFRHKKQKRNSDI